MKTEDFNFGDNRSVTDTSDNRSVASYATSVYSETIEDGNRQNIHHGKKIKQFQKITPQTDQNVANARFQQLNKKLSSTTSITNGTKSSVDMLDRMDTIPAKQTVTIKDSFAKQVYLETSNRTPFMKPVNDVGGGLAKKLKTHHKIRESMEMDLNASMVSICNLYPCTKPIRY